MLNNVLHNSINISTLIADITGRFRYFIGAVEFEKDAEMYKKQIRTGVGLDIRVDKVDGIKMRSKYSYDGQYRYRASFCKIVMILIFIIRLVRYFYSRKFMG